MPKVQGAPGIRELWKWIKKPQREKEEMKEVSEVGFELVPADHPPTCKNAENSKRLAFCLAND